MHDSDWCESQKTVVLHKKLLTEKGSCDMLIMLGGLKPPIFYAKELITSINRERTIKNAKLNAENNTI